jgi:thiamine-phosphate pyrophosphorylase
MKPVRGLYVITPEEPGSGLGMSSASDDHAGDFRDAGGRAASGVAAEGAHPQSPAHPERSPDPCRSRATQSLIRRVELALAGGARLVQYRDKSRDLSLRLAQARALGTLCDAAGVPLIINDDIQLAAAVSADGVHLGRDDPDPREARRLLGPSALIGVSCYDRLDLAEAAQAAGADYVAFGSFFPSSTKPLAVRADLDLLRQARRRIRLPLVAIGGITPENGAALIEAGADLLAVVSGVFGAPDLRAAAAAYARLFATPDP